MEVPGERQSFSVDIKGLLEALTEQFPEPLLCVRELVQNAADASAKRIEVDVAYDAVGRDTIERSIRCLRRRGTVINYGGASGLVDTISPLALAEAGSVFFTRPHLADYIPDAEAIRMRTDDLFQAWRDGLHVGIDRVLPLENAAQAHRILEGRGTTGKLLLGI